MGLRVDRGHGRAPDVDAAAGEEVQAALTEAARLDPRDAPVLAQAHRERVASIHEDDLVLGREAVPQPERGRDAAEPGTEHEHAMHQSLPLRRRRAP